MRLKIKYLKLRTQLLILLIIVNKSTPEFIKLTVENSPSRLKQANLATKGDIADFVKKTDFDHELKNLN